MRLHLTLTQREAYWITPLLLLKRVPWFYSHDLKITRGTLRAQYPLNYRMKQLPLIVDIYIYADTVRTRVIYERNYAPLSKKMKGNCSELIYWTEQDYDLYYTLQPLTLMVWL